MTDFSCICKHCSVDTTTRESECTAIKNSNRATKAETELAKRQEADSNLDTVYALGIFEGEKRAYGKAIDYFTNRWSHRSIPQKILIEELRSLMAKEERRCS